MDGKTLTRRQLLGIFGTAGVACLLGETMSEGNNLVPAKNAVDHLLLGVADLDYGITWIERLTGVKAIVGGSHPSVGTRNALISLGLRQYLEIIAPDPLQKTYTSAIDVRKLSEPRLIAWAAVSTNLDDSVKKAQEAGNQVLGPRDGSRARPDGRILKWRTMRVLNKAAINGVDPIPFFIQWAADSLHPAEDSPKGCELLSFEIEHPDPTKVVEVLTKLDIEAKVRQADNAKLIATLKTLKGRVLLS